MARWSTRDKAHAVLLLISAVGLVVHLAVLWHWYVEDAAISFAYARHLIQGEGLVAFPGGERVEGYSNPTWVLVLAALQLVGFDPFVSTKFVQAAICVATLPVVYFTIRETTGKNSDLPIVAVVFLAINAQFTIWGGAGLENALLNFLIAAGFWRMLIELRPGQRFPWSAAIWLLVALTRPEGILYAAVAGFLTMVFQLEARRPVVGSTIVWLAVFFVPFGLYHAVHYWYFAWPLPNTYYAKLEDRDSVRWIWDKTAGGKNPQAWNWTRNFFHEMGQGYFLPIWILGIVGDGRVRYAIATAVFLLVGGMIELSHDQRWLLPVVVGSVWAAFWLGLRATEPRPPRWLPVAATFVALFLVGTAEILRSWGLQPNQLPVPGFVKVVPPYVLATLGVVLPIVSYRSRGWQLRVLAWSFCCAVIFFAIYVQWDWMKGFRWYSTAAVPGSILFAFGIDAFVRLVAEMFGWTRETRLELPRIPSPPWRLGVLQRIVPVGRVFAAAGRRIHPGMVLAAVIVLLQLPANVLETKKILDAPDAAPKGIKARVDFVRRVRERLHIDEKLVDLDVDQGAHLWWSDFEMMDVAGLVDLPRAHHGFEKAFIKEYVFEERRPHYAHVHGGWAGNSKIPSHPEWRQQYLEIPGYPAGKTQVHPGNFIRRDLVVYPEWPHEGEPVVLQNGIELYRPHVESEPGVDRRFYVEVGIASPPPPRATILARKAADAEAPKPSPPGPAGAAGPAPKPEPRIQPKDRNFRAILFASDGTHLHSWDLPPGYDWLKPEKWEEGDIFVGKFDLSLPPTLPPGTYDLGYVIIGADGLVIGPKAAEDPVDPPAIETTPRMATGEVLFPGALTILSLEDRGNAAIADREAALAAAERLDCESAENSWRLAKHHRAGDHEWEEQFLPDIRTAFATCWAKSADGKDRDDQVRRLVRARTWDWWNDEYRARAPALAQELYDLGWKAREEKDWEAAYRLFSDAVDVDRTRSWARRYAEEARGYRLGIDPESLEKKELELAMKKAAAEEARDKRAAEVKAKHDLPELKDPEDEPEALVPPEGE